MSRRHKPNEANPESGSENPKRLAITRIDQLKPQDVEVVIQQGEYELVIPMRTLTFAEAVQIDREIPNPVPPSMGGPKGMMYDRQNPAYVQALDEAAQKRMLLRIARCLRIEGVGGATPDEEIEAIKTHIDQGIINGLSSVIRQLTVEHNARIEARANSFQRPGIGLAADM